MSENTLYKGIRISKSGIFFVWNQESWALGSGKQLKESEIPLTTRIRNPLRGIQNPRLPWIPLHRGERNHGGKNKWNVSASKRFCTSLPYRLENALTILPKEKAGTQRGFSSRKRLLHAILLTLTEIGYRNQRPLKTLKLQYRGQVTSTPIRRCVAKRHVEKNKRKNKQKKKI